MNKKKTTLTIALVASLFLMSVFSIVLNIRPVKADPGCVTVTVEYNDGCPRSDAYVWTTPYDEKNPNAYLGITGEDGKVTNCDHGLSEGDHWVKAFWPDSGTQFGPDTYLYVDSSGDGITTITAGINETLPPDIVILSPQNITYTTSPVPLTFTYDDYSEHSWYGYSLDGQANATITGNTTLTVAEGQHNVIVYANDTYGNMGHSDKVYFTVQTQPVGGIYIQPNILELLAPYIALTSTIIVATAAMAIYVKRKKGKG